ncbi:MAG TPA: AtpZ/AtpI family protein [Saprospiraceae bacterium]|nr:AtpZ/AtpI family protein [Saprospiraceae bacterium]
MDKHNKNGFTGGSTALKYSGMAFEMLATILLGWWIGKKLDEYLEYHKPVFTIILILLFCFISLWRVVNSLNKDNNK